MLHWVLTFSFIGGIFAQTPGFGHCPSVEPLSVFNIQEFIGQWYENRRNVPNFFEAETKCVKVIYSTDNNNALNIVKERVSSITGTETELIGSAVVDMKQCGQTPENCSKYLFKFSLPLVGNIELPYEILDTDYISYAIVYSCKEIFGGHAKYLWVLTREQNPPSSVLDAVDSVLDKHDLLSVPTVAVNQKNCKNSNKTHN